jgi:hypothetical protein
MLIAISESRGPRRNSVRYPVNALLKRLEAEKAQLRRNVVDLVLQIQVSRDSVR